MRPALASVAGFGFGEPASEIFAAVLFLAGSSCER